MTSKYHQQARATKKKMKKKKIKGKFPDMNKDGKITFADIIMARKKGKKIGGKK